MLKMINGSELMTPNMQQEAYTMELIAYVTKRAIEAEDRGHDNIAIRLPMSTYLAVKWNVMEKFFRIQGWTATIFNDHDEKHKILKIKLTERN